MTVDATVVINQSENTLLLPLEVLIEEDGKNSVFIPGSQKEPNKVPIKVGLRNDEIFEVLEVLQKDQEVLIPTLSIQTSQPNQNPMGMGVGGPPPERM